MNDVESNIRLNEIQYIYNGRTGSHVEWERHEKTAIFRFFFGAYLIKHNI